MTNSETAALLDRYCPMCGQHDVYAIRMYCTGNSQTGTVFVAGHAELNVGLSPSESKLVKALTPEMEPRSNSQMRWVSAYGAVISIVFVLASLPSAGWVVFWLGIAALLVWRMNRPDILRRRDQERAAWQLKKHVYEQGWVCVGCGHTWIPKQ